MLITELKITNSRGDSINFGRHFRLINGLDLTTLKANVSYSQSSGDGANYQRTFLDIRSFDLEFFINKNHREEWWVEERRREAFRVFNPKHNPFRLEFTTKGGNDYYFDANLEMVPNLPRGFENNNRAWQKGLLQFSCSDPNIYSATSTTVELAAWIGAFEFPLEITGEGIELGYRSKSLIANVLNDGDNDTGMIIRFKALATVQSPSLINVNTYQQLKLNFVMQGGDLIEISTYSRKKTVTLIRNNVRSNIFNSVDYLSSTFLQLEPGDNLFRYDAESGLDNLEVSMTFTNRMIGV